MSDHHHDRHDLRELLDLDAEVFASALNQVYADIQQAAAAPIASIIDIGAGTGTGTFGLLRHFTSARAIAIAASAEMLAPLEHRAVPLGLSDRVTTRQADLDAGLPDLGQAELEQIDLVWASASLHHLADPDRTLTQIAGAVRPGGLVAVAELSGLPRFVPDESPGGRAELRAHELMAADRAVDLPTMGSDWGVRLSRAGLVVEQQRPIAFDSTRPASDPLGRYAELCLTRIRGAVADRLGPDLTAFDTLLDGGAHDVRRRSDLRVTADRSLWIARRPGDRPAQI